MFIVHRIIGDKVGEAKASGNLGNTLKLLGKFDEATACCQRQFDIYKDLDDSVSASMFQAGSFCFVSQHFTYSSYDNNLCMEFVLMLFLITVVAGDQCCRSMPSPPIDSI